MKKKIESNKELITKALNKDIFLTTYIIYKNTLFKDCILKPHTLKDDWVYGVCYTNGGKFDGHFAGLLSKIVFFSENTINPLLLNKAIKYHHEKSNDHKVNSTIIDILNHAKQSKKVIRVFFDNKVRVYKNCFGFVNDVTPENLVIEVLSLGEVIGTLTIPLHAILALDYDSEFLKAEKSFHSIQNITGS